MLTQIASLEPQMWAALGAAGSALLAAMAYVLKLHHERTRTLRTVVYLLLQLKRHAVIAELYASSMPRMALKALDQVLREVALTLDDAVASELILEASPALRAAAEASMRDERREVKELLAKAIAELSRDSPVLAFRLSFAIPRAQEAEVDTALEVVVPKATRPDEVERVIETFKSRMSDESARSRSLSLSHSLRLAAFHAGPFTYVGALLSLHGLRQVSLASEAFDDLIPPMREALSASLSTVQNGAAEAT